MGFLDTVRARILQFLMPEEWMNTPLRERLEMLETYAEYYAGNQRRQIKVKPRQADDNVTLNYVKLVVDRSVALLTGGNVGFDLPGEPEDEPQVYIDGVYEANKRAILLQNAAHAAAVYGTGYFKILPNSIQRPEDVMPRLVVLDPRWMHIHTEPEDVQQVTAYETRFSVVEGEKRVNRREIIERQVSAEGLIVSWLVRNFVADEQGRWRMTDEELWPYEFAPIIHWQNLPRPNDVYGASDVGHVIELQDKINFVAGNMNRIIRFHAHPKTIGVGVTAGSMQSAGVDDFWSVPTGANIYNLEMQSELQSSAAYLLSLRQSLFDLTRTVDISSMADRLGALTNFGLRVLYADALAKLGSKQALFGDALLELNRRLLLLRGLDADPGAVVWPETLPQNELEQMQSAQLELGLGIASKQTIATERGRDWEQELERLQEETAAQDNIGAALLRAFNAGA